MQKFVVIAQNLNAANEKIRFWLITRKTQPLVSLARRLVRVGSEYLDLMLNHPGLDPMTAYPWVIQTLQQRLPHVRFALDVADLEVVQRALAECRQPPLLNGILGWPLDDAVLGLLERHPAPVVAPCATRQTVQLRSDERLEIAYLLYRTLKQTGRSDHEIYFDPQLFPLNPPVPANRPWDTLETIGKLRHYFPRCHIVIGLENLTFRRRRKLEYQMAFLSMALARGLSAAILDPLKEPLRRVWTAAQDLVAPTSERSAGS